MKPNVLSVVISAFCLCDVVGAQNTTSSSNPLFNQITLRENAGQNIFFSPDQRIFLEAQSQNPATGTYQPIQPIDINQNGPQPIAPEQAPANELLPSEKKNVVEAATAKLWRLIFTIGAGVFYDDNIFISHTDRKADTVFTIDGGFAFELGDYRNQADNYLIAKYLVTGYLFTRNTGQDSADQDAVLRDQYRFGNFTFQNQITFDYLNGSDRTVGTFVTRYLLDGSVKLLYDVSPKTQLFAQFEQVSSIYRAELSSYEYIGRVGVDYLITPKIKLGVQGVVGDLVQQNGPSSLYGQGELRAAYQYTEKLTFRGAAGFQVTSYSNSDLIKLTPVFELGADYQAFVDTKFSLTAFRKIFASPLVAGQFFTGTGVSFTAEQKFLQRITADITVGYEHDSYNSTGGPGSFNIGRDDDYVYIRPSLTYNFRQWLSITVYYQYSRNSSTISSDTFYDNRVGGQISFTF
jgi:Putative beta-barrel porin 2